MTDEIFNKIKTFFDSYPPARYKKKEMILRADDPVNWIYFLQSGLVRQYIITPNGDEVTIHLFEPNSFFPTMLLVGHIENRFNFEANTDVELRKTSPEHMTRFLTENPDVLFDLTSRFARAIDGLSRRVEMLATDTASTKVIGLLCYLGQKFGTEQNNTTVIDIPLTHADIANWVGDSRETVSRQMEKLAKNKLISYKNHSITLLNVDELVRQLPEHN
jgi:CRP-like cAMP-binding protein